MEQVSVAVNYYTVLGVPLGASIRRVREAADRLRSETVDRDHLDQIADAEYWLTSPSLRSYHDAQIRWAAAGEWWGQRHPAGTSADRHSYWADFRRKVIEEDPSFWHRVRHIFDDALA